MEVAEIFPALSASGFRLTSPQTGVYNCIAWAAGADDTWWDPATGYYWPDGVPRDGSVQSLIRVFESLGYTKCAEPGAEKGFDKVAIYGDTIGYTHAARQLLNGKWTSKIGTLEDIEHAALDGLAGTEYGRVAQILKRKATP